MSPNPSKQLTLILLIVLILLGCTAQQEVVVQQQIEEQQIVSDPDPYRYANAIEKFRQADSAQASPEGALLFVGSSSVRGWKTLAEDLSEYDVINRGFGGSHFSDLIVNIDDLVFAHQPGAIFVYEGDNDIAWGKSPQRVYQDYLKFIQLVREKWMEVPVYFISIKPSIDRIGVIKEMAEANALILAHIETDASLHYVDVFSVMVDESGQPIEEIFGQDGLHMNAAGYDLWEAAVKKAVE